MSLLLDHLPAITGFMGASSVFAGAYGAHGLQGKLSEKGIKIWKTAVQYHQIHSLALLGLTFSGAATATQGGSVASHLFAIGTVLFSFNIYFTSFLNPAGKLKKVVGPLTPIGGMTLMAGWVSLAWARPT